MPELAGRRVRVADWYVEYRQGQAVEVENETYTTLCFDQAGWARYFPDSELGSTKASSVDATDRHAEPRTETEYARAGTPGVWFPTEQERQHMRQNIEHVSEGMASCCVSSPPTSRD